MRALGGLSVFSMIVAASSVSLAGAPGALHTITFAREVQNLRFSEVPLMPQLRHPVAIACESGKGPAGYGAIPHRRIGEPYESTDHFIAFAAVYPPGSRPLLFVDLDGNRRLTCDERLDPVAHPQDPERMFRTVTVEWRDGGPARSRIYRITMPARFDGGSFAIDLVDAPVARWSVDGHDSLWVLLDGNHDGVIDKRFGDSVLVDADGSGRLDLSPDSPDLYSFHAPLTLPWGAFEVSEVDAEGRFLKVVEVDPRSVERFRPLSIGDSVPPMTCRAQDGSAATIGGKSEGGQLVYFWLAHCGNCIAAFDALSPEVPELTKQGIALVGVSLDESEASFREFVGQRMLLWPQCFSGKMLTDNPIARRLGVRDPAEFVVIGPDGRIVAKFRDHDAVRAELSRLGMGRKARAGL